MKRRLIWLVTASLVYASPHVFSVTEDLLAYPQVPELLYLANMSQYEVIFFESFISDKEAEFRIAEVASRSSSVSRITSITLKDAALEPVIELSQKSFDFNSLDPDFSFSFDIYERMILNNKSYLCSISSVFFSFSNFIT